MFGDVEHRQAFGIGLSNGCKEPGNSPRLLFFFPAKKYVGISEVAGCWWLGKFGMIPIDYRYIE